jgi:hypothetical protein
MKRPEIGTTVRYHDPFNAVAGRKAEHRGKVESVGRSASGVRVVTLRTSRGTGTVPLAWLLPKKAKS